MEKSKQNKKRITLWVSLVVIFVLIPATVALSYVFGDRKLYIASVIIVILAMVPFFVSFENKKPNVRYLATIAVLTAIVVISRVIFLWLPSFKPMAGIIILIGMSFGPQAGFMSGAISMIISNMIFGQGPWTPWQMFCYGLIGLIAGFLSKAKILSQKHIIRTSIISFFLIFILSGIILDTNSLLWLSSSINLTSALTFYIAGMPMNITNGLTGAVTVFILIKPFFAIITRLKNKYGISD